MNFNSIPFPLESLKLFLGQVGAWNAYPSSYAVEVMDESDIVNAVNFARINNLRLVVKGTGKMYAITYIDW